MKSKNKKVKFKIKKSVSTRFKITKTGKVLRGSQNLSHLRSKKSKRTLRRMKEQKVLKGTFAKKIKKMLGK